MKNKSILLAVFLVIVTVIVVMFFNKDEVRKSNVKIVTNASNFYTVNSCLYRIVSYVSEKNSKSLLLTLNDSYRKNNKITESNVLELFNSVEPNSTFVSKKMYYERINEDITKYYVYGYIEVNQLSDGDVSKKLDRDYEYFIIYLNSNKKIFSFEPYDGQLFIGGEANEE